MYKEITAILHSKFITVSTYDFFIHTCNVMFEFHSHFKNTFTSGVLFVGHR